LVLGGKAKKSEQSNYQSLKVIPCSFFLLRYWNNMQDNVLPKGYLLDKTIIGKIS